ncbi:MAG: PilZ domain-containing protein [Promethearchaeota archaeon]
MGKGRSPRVVFKLNATSTSGNTSYNGYIENFSREGMLKIIPNGQVLNILLWSTMHVSLETPSGQNITLECEVRWVRRYSNMPFGLIYKVGMKIKNPPQKYNEFIHVLYREYLHESTTCA